jgi:uncharacterized membrane-anchored protein
MKIAIIIFAVVFAVQWWVPVKTIFNKQRVLNRGTTFKFLTEPVDPTNPFKGKYITLRFKSEAYRTAYSPSLKYNEPVYAVFENDKDGFAQVKALHTEEPSNETAYCEASVRFISSQDSITIVQLEFPFEEYYMEESKAPRAETIYRESLSDTLTRTYALVKIYKGDAVIGEVFVKDRPINELLK